MKKRYKVLEDFENLREGDIVVENDRFTYLYNTDKVGVTIWTIEKNPNVFEPMDI